MAGGEETVRVRIEMDAGRLELELYPSRAPLTVANFLQYVDAGNLPHTSTWNTIG
jgi:cyclophilin family peptidyl-prolyl cis-trans isomerase